jgi:hypothetical protein
MGASVGSAAVSDPFAPDAGGLPTGQDLEVDLGAFLPPDVVVGEPPAEHEGPGPDLAALEQLLVDLTAVDAALAALDAGTYGRCAACDEPIADDLFAADPTRTTCAIHD